MHGLVLLWLHAAYAFTVGSLQATPTTFSSAVAIAGLPFNVKVNGAGFDKMNDRVIIIESDKNCGTEPAEHDVPYFMNVPCNLAGSAPTLLICGEIILTRKAQYTICVCNSAINSCDDISHFTDGGRNNGVFDLHGPVSETHTVRAGVPGIIMIHGQQFHARDRFRILDGTASCSSASVSHVPALLEGAVGQRTTGGSDFSKWNDVLMGLGSGEFQLCWCSGMVGTCLDTMYTVPCGRLVVEGPELRDPTSWTTGLVNVVHLYGWGLVDTDRMRIRFGTHDCGDNGSAKHSSGVLIEPADVRSAGDSVSSHWGSVTISLRGDYVVCWCGREAGVCTDCCEMDQHYNILAARITVAGPQQGLFVQAVVGRLFEFSMTNTLPGVQDRIRLVTSFDACTTASTPMAVFQHPAGPPRIDGFTQSWDMVVGSQSLIKVCWCPEESNCFDDTDFTVEVGLIEFVGPIWKQVNIVKHAPFKLSITSRKLTSGEIITLPTDRFRIVSHDVVDCGKFGSLENTPTLATEICWPQCNPANNLGAPTRVVDSTEEWEPLMLTEIGRYRVCWCPSVNDCDKMEDFNAFVMTLNVVGVTKDQSFSCASNEDCKIEVVADGALQLTDYVQLIKKEPQEFCGRTPRVSVNHFEYGSRVLASPPPDPGMSVEQAITFDFGQAREPGVYSICYCQSYEDCSEDVHFFQTAGILRVSGISDGEGTHMCYMKTDCQVHLLGTLLSPSTDAVMVYSEHAECGTNSNTYGSYFRNRAFTLTDGGWKFLGTEGPLQNDLVTAVMELGLPTRPGNYRVCYCNHRQAQGGFCMSRTDFRLAAGYLRIGGVDFPAQVTCMQGEECDVGLVGNFGDEDWILIIRYDPDVQCGDSQAEPATGFGWNPSKSEAGVISNPEKNNRLELHYALPRVDKPGKFRICFCGKVSDAACKLDEWWHWKHEAGVLNVLGVIHEVVPYLKATPRVVSVAVETVVGGGGIHCSVSDRGALDYYTVPTTDELMDCANPDVRRGPTEEPMPLCLARASLDGFAEIGTNIIHIPLTGFPTEKVHVWCYTDMFCQSKRCVSPPTSTGLVIPINGTMRSDADYTVTSVGMPFDLRLATNVPASDVRIKIVEMEGSCELQELTQNVIGLSCQVGTLGKCEPAPDPLTESGVSYVVWQNLLVHIPTSYQICYCDRHYDNSCVVWEESGRIEAQGPDGQPAIQGNPGSEVIIGLPGRGFGVGDRVRIVDVSEGCYVPQSTTAAPTNDTNSTDNGTRRLATVWQSGAPLMQNATYEEWRVRLNSLGKYTICWCGGAHRSGPTRCVSPSDYTLNAGSVDIAERMDCVMGDVLIIEACTKPCGGGTRREKRRIVTQATGGGLPCESDAEEVKSVNCNEDPCPLARLDKAEFDPPTPVQGRAFTMTLDGMFLSNEDRVLIVEKEIQCGQETTHSGGATCRVVNRMDDGLGNKLECGDGLRSIILQKPGEYRVCFCDATAAILRNADGSSGITSSPMTGHGVFSAGCSATVAYVLSPTDNAIFTVINQVDPNAQNVICSSFTYAANCALHAECTWTYNKCQKVAVTILGMPEAVFVTTVCIVCVGFVMLFLLAVWYRRNRRRKIADVPYRDMDRSSAWGQPAADDMRAAQEHYQMMQHWDAYYQSLGYPAGTAWLMHGKEGASPTHAQPMEAIEYGGPQLSIGDMEQNTVTPPGSVHKALMDDPQYAQSEMQNSGTWGDQLKNLPLPAPPAFAARPVSANGAGGARASFSDRVRRATLTDPSSVTVKPANGGSPTPRMMLSPPPPLSTPPVAPKPRLAPPTESPGRPQFSPPKPPSAPASPKVLAIGNGDDLPPPMPDQLPPVDWALKDPQSSRPPSQPPSQPTSPKADAAEVDSLAVSSDTSAEVTPRLGEAPRPSKNDAVAMLKSLSTLRRRKKQSPTNQKEDNDLKSGLGLGSTPSSPSTSNPLTKPSTEESQPKSKIPPSVMLRKISRTGSMTETDEQQPGLAEGRVVSDASIMPVGGGGGGGVDLLDATIRSDVSLMSMKEVARAASSPKKLDRGGSIEHMEARLPQPPDCDTPDVDPLDCTMRSDVSIRSMPRPPIHPKADLGSTISSDSSNRRPPPAPGRRPPPPPPPRKPTSALSLDLDSTMSDSDKANPASPSRMPGRLSLGRSAANSNAVQSVKPPSPSNASAQGRMSPSSMGGRMSPSSPSGRTSPSSPK